MIVEEMREVEEEEKFRPWLRTGKERGQEREGITGRHERVKNKDDKSDETEEGLKEWRSSKKGQDNVRKKRKRDQNEEEGLQGGIREMETRLGEGWKSERDFGVLRIRRGKGLKRMERGRKS